MKRTVGCIASLFTLLLALSTAAKAEVLTATVQLSPAAEVNPPAPPPANASGGFQVTVNVTRDASGNVTAGAINFLGIANFPGGAAITVVGLHIHEGAINANGPVRFDSGLSAASPLMLPTGVGLVNQNATSVDVTVLGRLLANPASFYVNLHTAPNPAGAIRAQIVRLVETQSVSVQMTPAQENPPITTVTASGTGTITINPVRNPATGAVTGGTVTFTIQHDIPAGSVITGLHIHEQVAGMNGGVVINTGVGAGASSIPTASGKGTINFEVPITTAAQIGALQRLLANPVGFYVNLHTSDFGGGLIRGQLVATAAPLVIQQSTAFFLETGATDTQFRLLLSSIDPISIPSATILVNGQMVTAPYDFATGTYNVTIPAALRANAGTLLVQARNTAGVMSAPVAIVVAAAANVNAFAMTTVDAARFGNTVAPETIVAGFGTRIASQSAGATSQPLPIALDGTSIFVNGIAARLFFVSANQANYLVPTATGIGPAAVVVVARDGSVSRGALNVSQTSPSIFTMTANGVGAPAAVASADGTTFNIVMGNPDGTPREIGAGNFVMLFGTAMRFGSTALTNAIKIGTTDVTPTFIGPVPGLAGLEQANLQIPQSLAGAGNVDLTLTVDGKVSNVVKLRIR